ncbi:Xaa-Pro dipeptidase [Amylolactobacillus amylophilus]|nr:Xaa-Pro dipeptidase [Amylolactobacillus amylophilus]
MIQLDKLQKWLQDTNTDVAYISDPVNVNYFSGYGSDPEERVLALFVFKDAAPFLFTPQLNVEEAKNSEFDSDVYGYLDHENPFKIIAERIKERTNHFEKWAIEKDNLSVFRYQAIKTAFPTASFTQDASRFIEQTRLYKTQQEIAIMEQAGADADFAFEVAFNAVQTGVSERGLVGQIEYELKKRGVMEMSFDTIVQTGANAANPHGGPTLSTVQPNELILFDLGTVKNGYMSDATRTVAYGTPSDKALDIFKVCLEANLTAMDKAKPGITAAELDAVARDIITKAGYGEYFNHRLGHGIGKSTHEFPSLMEGNDMELEPGMCFSIEPGIYIPGVAGVRIEDCGHLTENGFVPFTHTPKELKTIAVH